MSKHTTHSIPAEGTFDRVTMESSSGQLTTLQDELPYRISGFHWQFVTELAERCRNVVGWDAVGTVDGQAVVRGIVEDVYVGTTGLAEVFVAPP